MGCITSKHLPPADCKVAAADHAVTLTSTTYGVLDLSARPPAAQEAEREKDIAIAKEWSASAKKPPSPPRPTSASKKKPLPLRIPDKPHEVINAWEIMAGLEDVAPAWSPMKKALKLLSPSPKKAKRRSSGGNKENSPLSRGSEPRRKDGERVLKPFNTWDGVRIVAPPNSAVSKKCTPSGARILKKTDSNVSSSRRSLSPLFDPELLAAIEKEISDEKEQIKKMVAPSTAGSALLESFQRICPPGGENVVVLYTTSLRGIRKTFEECNGVRSAIATHDVLMVERDVSMDSGYREELKQLLKSGEVRVPAVFVKGRFIGGAAAVWKLEEEGKLAVLLKGMPRAKLWCAGCAGARFAMCRRCNGSCKVLDGEGKKTAKCGECNENGLIRCPLCAAS